MCPRGGVMSGFAHFSPCPSFGSGSFVFTLVPSSFVSSFVSIMEPGGSLRNPMDLHGTLAEGYGSARKGMEGDGRSWVVMEPSRRFHMMSSFPYQSAHTPISQHFPCHLHFPYQSAGSPISQRSPEAMLSHVYKRPCAERRDSSFGLLGSPLYTQVCGCLFVFSYFEYT